MEVHHHPDLHHKPKAWKEYFLEFLMIFLAVTMGFIAESLRERINDHIKEKEYIHSLLADLGSDQNELDKHIHDVKIQISMLDSEITILDTPSLIPTKSGQLYYFARVAPRLIGLSVNNRTFEQLKNSGNFRLIKNIYTSNKIMDYYDKLPIIQQIEAIHETEFQEYKKIASKVFSPAEFVKMEKKNQATNGINLTTENPPLRTMDNELLQELSVFAVYMNGSKKGVLSAELDEKQTGIELINYLKKIYHM